MITYPRMRTLDACYQRQASADGVTIKTLERMLAEALTPVRRAKSTATVEERRLDKNALARAKRLAAQHGIEVEYDPVRGGPGWWVSHGEATFCTSGREVEAAVHAYFMAIIDCPESQNPKD